ncbi:hypothetical protein Tsubulata_013544 [Turnera subulata]|uniref:Bifunctional inhibitor/plant lipid transfer protein/seed storage helical domain-containing protein n=1 Tax=Turnera subulata TaxID=218843 RepID=A0A9Q0JMP9_9ROSI|nr:hypothetical protein Tsubulata_013544 [Turnera subulata]
MASFKISMGVMIMVVLFMATTTSFTEAQDVLSCAQNLIPCQPYLNETVTPPANCCNPIKEAVTKDLTCLCNLYNDPNLLASLNVNVTQAIELTGRCNIPADISQCKGVPGNDGSRMAWTGFTSLCLLGLSSLFY